MAGMMERQRHALGRIVLEIEKLLGEIRSLQRRDRSHLTAADCQRLDVLLERKRTQLREMESRATRVDA
jgi:hypothetical protein